jgi:hypothetical protein
MFDVEVVDRMLNKITALNREHDKALHRNQLLLAETARLEGLLVEHRKALEIVANASMQREWLAEHRLRWLEEEIAKVEAKRKQL